MIDAPMLRTDGALWPASWDVVLDDLRHRLDDIVRTMGEAKRGVIVYLREGSVGVGHKDRNRPAQARIDCLVDLAHPPLTQRGHNLVRAQTGTGNQRHCGGIDYKRQLIAPLAGRRALL